MSMCTSICAGQEKSAMSEITERFIETNGIRMRIKERGEGPLVLLVHGWPESWYSWRHQMKALADAGYHAVAPDMRGYGKTDSPYETEAYTIYELAKDVVGIIDAIGEETALLVGHDWGAIVAWHCVLVHPERFTGHVSMSVPYYGRGPMSTVDVFRQQYGDNFFYILYFQDEGKAEAEFDADPRGILSRLFRSPKTPTEAPSITDPKMSAGGWIGRLGAPTELPNWLAQSDLDYYVGEFTRAGFRGGINYYRNFDRNWELTEEDAKKKIETSIIFIAGQKDRVIGGAGPEQLKSLMKKNVPGLKGVHVIPTVGHWVQQEAPEETNAIMLEFFRGFS